MCDQQDIDDATEMLRLKHLEVYKICYKFKMEETTNMKNVPEGDLPIPRISTDCEEKKD